ncbi:MAG: immunity 53 family protein [Acidobacteria bacterium]|nr:immunity 53 family protein [Acidobacteriota bacterium]
MSSIEWLQYWYLSQCNDHWEHRYGVRIQSLDNPGWIVRIDLRGTALAGRPFKNVKSGEPVNHIGLDGVQNWFSCERQGDEWVGACGPLLLETICDVFREWAGEA